MRRKVLFFDSWKGGINNFLRLNESFDENGIDRLLIHLGSWGNEEITVKEEVISRLLVRDISYYSNSNFKKILELEKPNLVLFLSTHTFAHRAMIRHCKSQGIPTINLYHGFVRVQSVDTVQNPYKVNKFAYLKFALNRLPKMLTKTLPCYVSSMIITKASFEEWMVFIRNLREIVTKPSNLRVAKDSKTTLCLVYANADKQHAIKTYGFVEDEIIDVGNPDLITFGLKTDFFGFGLKSTKLESNKIIYIDTALTATGLIFANQSEFIEHLIETKKALNEQGFNLSLKPHPETKRLYDLNLFRNSGIDIIENEMLMQNLLQACAVIVEPSSLALIPALMGIPIILPTYGKLKKLLFGEVLISYPRAIKLSNLTQLSGQLKIEREKIDKNNFSDWVNLNAGPLPAEDMPQRVTSQILKLINEK